ncbi:hypothetical protein KBC86_02635 [Candidatus Gracilibacteria bacterium]|nr:hypothetical protein [Candidatus Gracilibacteria bacterium]
MKKHIIWFILLLLAIATTYIFVPRPYQVHWHANFALYMSGELVDFSGNEYMEETSRCNVTTDVRPEDRIHLHDNKGGLVHVHMAGSTWGDLFSNLSWSLGQYHMADIIGNIYQPTSENKLIYLINGKPVMNPVNELVKSTDRLLVWYGTGTEEEIVKKWESLVPKDADEYNHKPDPAACGSNSYGWLTPIAEPLMNLKEKLFHSHDE